MTVLEKHIYKISSYKYNKCRRKYCRKHFGIADRDTVTFDKLIILIVKVIAMVGETV